MKDTTANRDNKIALNMDATGATTDQTEDDNAALDNKEEGGSVNRAMSKFDNNTKRQKQQDSLEHIKKGTYIHIEVYRAVCRYCWMRCRFNTVPSLFYS